MIEVSYKGRLGNNLFQYAIGRILAERYGFRLDATPVHGFPNTEEEIDGAVHTTPFKKLRYNRIRIDRLDGYVEKYNGMHILLRGTFSYYPHYVDHKEEIRKWFHFDPVDLKDFDGRFKVLEDGEYKIVPVDNISSRDVLLHIRLGDLLSTKEKRESRGLYFDYYDIVLRNIEFDRLFIISDTVDHAEVQRFSKYNPIHLFDTGSFDTFRFFKSFNRIIMSRSSYAWWGAWLSDAEEIYFPIPIHGLWGQLNGHTDADLRVNEDRYIYVSQMEEKFLGGYDDVREIYSAQMEKYRLKKIREDKQKKKRAAKLKQKEEQQKAKDSQK